MAKQKKSQSTLSPLSSSVDKSSTEQKEKKKPKKDKQKQPRRGDMTEEKLAEEAALTALLFGGGGVNPDMNVDRGENSDIVNDSEQAGDLMFAIDRSGLDDEDANDEEVYSDGKEDASDEEESSEEEDGQQAVSMSGAAWQDDDDDSGDERGESKNNISLVDGPNRIKKLRRYRDETDPISIKEYELRLRERFVNTASVAARTDWADVANVAEEDGDRKRPKISDSDDSEQSEEEDEQYSSVNHILQSNASLFATSSSAAPLPPTILDINRVRDGNIDDPSKSCVHALQFHPTAGKDYDGSRESSDSPLLMTAGMDKMLRFFRIDGEANDKVHGLHFDEMPIMCASFLGDSGSVVMSGRRPFFYVYDASSGNVERYHAKDFGSREKSLEKFAVSPDGRVIAFLANDGYIILLDGMSRRWIGDLRINGSVRALAFSVDGEYIMGSGGDGDVYKWNVKSRRCVDRFHNEDGTITSSLAASRDMLAVGAESGVVNLYDDKRSGSIPRSLSMMERSPIKSIMNLSTAADLVKFNSDGQILAMSSRREKRGLRLLHVPTATVFSNWPTSKTPLRYVWSMDFSPGSKYFCAGTDQGKCLLYQVKHYWND